MQTGLLLGRDHVRIGAVAALAEGRVALALSRGGAPKRYDYVEPNEDACAFAMTDRAWLLAVADGHWGARGAELALERVLERHAPRWLSPGALALAERWTSEAPEVVLDLNRTLLDAGGESAVGRTTLALCLVRPDDGWWAGLCMGDSHVFRVGGDTVREHFGTDERGKRSTFVGDSRIDRERAEQAVRAGVEPDGRGGAIVLATDGLSERGIGVERPGEAVAESLVAAWRGEATLRPLTAARGVAERALEAHRTQRSGDNIAPACLWLDA
jgi:serine/threonine protein phosphatase PrpC